CTNPLINGLDSW
nr:immunoglobulin heavy chain junction region [Macaca mulatta]